MLLSLGCDSLYFKRFENEIASVERAGDRRHGDE